MSLWDSLFNHLRQPIAQILLTRNDIADVSKLLGSWTLWPTLTNGAPEVEVSQRSENHQ